MTHNAPLASLLAPFRAAQHQHEHLHGLSTRLDGMCNCLSADPPLPLPPELEPATLIGEWSVQLSGHFAAEEGLRYFGTLATERPALVTTLADLRADHAEMLEAIEHLTLIAADPARRRELLTGTRELMARLRTHETVENAMLEEFFRDSSPAET